MSIASITSRISYTGDGATTTFAVPFYFQANADLVVILQDVLGNQTTQVLGTDYSLSGATVSSGGALTFTVAPITATLITVYRDPPLTQTTSYNNNDPFPAKSHELALDKTVTIDQRTRDLANRAIHLSDGEGVISGVLAPVATRQNKLLGFDTTGGLIYVTGPTYINSTASAVAVVDSRATAQAAVFNSSIDLIETHGLAAAGDGGGLDYVVGFAGSPAGKFQDAGGRWWTPAVPITPVPLLPNAITTPMLTAASVTYPKIQNVTAARLLGNPTGSAATVSEIILQGLSFQGSTLIGGALAGASGLVITNNAATPNSKIDIVADHVVMNYAGAPIKVGATAVTIDLITNGANGLDTGTFAGTAWYHLYLISNGTTVAGLASLAATAPTMPAGYLYACRVGVMRTQTGTPSLLRTRQLGRRVQYIVTASTNTPNVPVLITGISGNPSLATWTAVSISGVVPPTATSAAVSLVAQISGSSGGASAAPNAAYGVYNSLTNPPPLAWNFSSGSGFFGGTITADFVLESSNVYYNSNGANTALSVNGWTDKVNAS